MAETTKSDYANLSVKELKSLLNQRGIDFSDCVEKQELVKRLNSGASNSVPLKSSSTRTTTDHVAAAADSNKQAASSSSNDDSNECLGKLSVQELKRLLTQHHVNFSDCIEKSDLVARLKKNSINAKVAPPAAAATDATKKKVPPKKAAGVNNKGASPADRDPFGPLADGASTTVQGSGSATYKIKRTGNNYYCTCPNWKFQNKSPGQGRNCKHINTLRAGYETSIGDESARKRKQGPSSNNNGGAKKSKKKAGDDQIKVTLADKWNPDSVDPTGYYLSEKLDGMRCLWDGKAMWSRNGNVIEAPPSFIDALPPGFALDGELYIGRQKFQDLMSLKSNPYDGKSWAQIALVVFDAPLVAGDFPTRLQAAREALSKCQCPESVARILPHTVCSGADHVFSELESILQKGGEGVMLRDPKAPYKGGRSKNLLKVKRTFDAEAKVVGHEPGKKKHLGRLGSLKVVMIPSGKQFKVGTGFSDAERENPPPIGSTITYKYQEHTKDGLPRFPVFVRVRPYE